MFMSVANIIMGFCIVAAVVIGSLFAINYYMKPTLEFSNNGTAIGPTVNTSGVDTTTAYHPITDTYGNAPTSQNNNTQNVTTSGARSAVNVEGGFLLFVAFLIVFAIICYFAFNKR